MNSGTKLCTKHYKKHDENSGTKLRWMPSGLIPRLPLSALPLLLALLLLALPFLSRACLAGSPPQAEPHHRRPYQARLPARDMAAIRQVIGAYEQTWNRHDAHAFSLIFAPDAQFVNVRGVIYPGGRSGIEQAHRPLFATMFKDSHVTTDRMQIRVLRPDVATADVYWRMTGSTDRAGKPRGLVRGLRTMVLTKVGQGWQIAIFHNMEMLGPAAPAGGSSPPGSAAH